MPGRIIAAHNLSRPSRYLVWYSQGVLRTHQLALRNTADVLKRFVNSQQPQRGSCCHHVPMKGWRRQCAELHRHTRRQCILCPNRNRRRAAAVRVFAVYRVCGRLRSGQLPRLSANRTSCKRTPSFVGQDHAVVGGYSQSPLKISPHRIQEHV